MIPRLERGRLFFFPGHHTANERYGSNSLSAMSKSTLDAHTHLRQPGFEAILLETKRDSRQFSISLDNAACLRVSAA
ncbi:unnamed protein product [Euphydryas editha]|uniref:Uncharacterized protein n=1 Tax=Euphydryas editha TaxID=104508 RepID=A0AAU9V2U0_EUPED|nr:unnamed protein product [Euphydryas editha]